MATGEAGSLPRVLVWDSKTNAIHFTDRLCICVNIMHMDVSDDVFVFRGFHRRGVVHVAFSKDGQMLASVGIDVHHSVAVHRWAENELLFTGHVDKVSIPRMKDIEDVPDVLIIYSGEMFGLCVW